MRRATRNGVMAVAAASGAMAMALPAHADSAADGAAADSPGLISGNTVQLPVHVPVNVCGNTVNVVGLLNPATGNGCANEGAGHRRTPAASAHGHGEDAPGVVSGNGVHLPVHLPVNVTGNSADVVGVGNPAGGDESVNTPTTPRPPARPTRPDPTPAPAERPRKTRPVTQPAPHTARQPAPAPTEAALAHTGTDGTLPAVLSGTAMILSGAVLVRRFRPRLPR
ncbi:chaplin [Streptomyces broussonetiae]|uniref:Chaplin n=1 Tax=Streptomyces broussonetiae TaxID=2686304 RepID=A0ABV5EBT7_9ACTN